MGLLAYRRFFAKRIPNVPEAEIKPRPGVRRFNASRPNRSLMARSNRIAGA